MLILQAGSCKQSYRNTEWFLVLGTVLNILTYGIVFIPQSNPRLLDIIAFYRWEAGLREVRLLAVANIAGAPLDLPLGSYHFRSSGLVFNPQREHLFCLKALTGLQRPQARPAVPGNECPQGAALK